jgi:hypothetical protein
VSYGTRRSTELKPFDGVRGPRLALVLTRKNKRYYRSRPRRRSRSRSLIVDLGLDMHRLSASKWTLHSQRSKIEHEDDDEHEDDW